MVLLVNAVQMDLLAALKSDFPVVQKQFVFPIRHVPYVISRRLSQTALDIHYMPLDKGYVPLDIHYASLVKGYVPLDVDCASLDVHYTPLDVHYVSLDEV